jgi:DNA polymerase
VRRAGAAGPPAESFFPARRTLRALATAVDGCRACPLWRHATQGVFGAGPRDALLALVGEQPGDQEDLQGRPFVGPAGRLLDRCLVEVGLPRERLWLTNAVKHFKFEQRGKRRIHKTPSTTEVQACLPWLEVELEKVGPPMVVCLGATATRALLGPKAAVLRDRGKVFTTALAPWVMPTVHPSAVLRAPAGERQSARDAFLADLEVAARRYRRLVAGAGTEREAVVGHERRTRRQAHGGDEARRS